MLFFSAMLKQLRHGIDGAVCRKLGEWMHLRIARCADDLVGVGLNQQMAPTEPS